MNLEKIKVLNEVLTSIISIKGCNELETLIIDKITQEIKTGQTIKDSGKNIDEDDSTIYIERDKK